jgi:RNA polymerase sigma-70 factor, ECF subfamily
VRVGLIAGITNGRRSRRTAAVDEDELVRRLRDGDEQAFVLLVERHRVAMLRLARTFVASAAVAEEVVQDTWLAVVRGIDRFAGRSSFKTWLFQILVNRARSTGVREQRSITIGDPTPAVDRSRFDATGAWSSPPLHWIEDSDDRLVAASMSDRLQRALDELPRRQREVVILRDVDGLTSDEVCVVLDISDGNQRVLLHRGRSQLRATLERYVTA